eukprot:CAMPEP_0197944600 /NCGR_PEP_ID=MMETSP1439-20131203/125490_1 /TAXON_ID=66791 /ORGANISM="Gonyaulax spinifera, Strain CCMP409" /LENGTH=455 /DNA_ID=CAMNT_0043567853 /DNA_START=39 /DNA_END=1404 /DNA_ORIENTATION=+
MPGSEERPGLAREHGLRADAAEGHHGEAAILELLQLHLPRLVLLLGQEVLAQEKVAGLALDVALEALEAKPAAIDLIARDGREEGPHDARLDHRVVRVHGGRFLEHLAGETHAQVRGDPSDRREHADAAVLQLGLADEIHRQRVRNAKGVKALLTTHPAVEHLRALEEGDSSGHLGLSGGQRAHGREPWAASLWLRAAERGSVADGDVLDEIVHGGAPPAVGLEQFDGAPAKHVVLEHEADDGNHCEAAVVALHRLAPLELLLRDALKELRAQAKVPWAEAASARPRDELVGADEALELLLRDALEELRAQTKVPRAEAVGARLRDELVGADEGEQLDPALEGQRGERAEAGVEGLAAREAEDLRHDIADAGDHGNAAVLDLCVRVLLHLCLRVTQVQRVPLLGEGEAHADDPALRARHHARAAALGLRSARCKAEGSNAAEGNGGRWHLCARGH